MAEKERSVEEGLARLEAIAEELEGADVELENSVKLYEEGLQVYADVAKKLDSADLRVTQLQKALEDQAKKPR